MQSPIAAPGRNCWRRVPAHRVACLVDAEDYFAALVEALRGAERSILMVGWDIHSRLKLRRPSAGADTENELVALLEERVRSRRRLHVHILSWDHALVYALEREKLPTWRLGWRTHRRIHFRLDSEHPVAASHHQKIVVVDDSVAFSGGLDLTAARWDTREHRAEEPRRIDPAGQPYGPFHDVQIAVDGEAAAALGDLVRERWRRATGQRLGPQARGADRWPAGLTPQLREVHVTIARTEPAWNERPEVREVERLHLDAVQAARHCIYLENQYLTSTSIGDALAARLGEPDGPEIVAVLPEQCSGWLEETSMGVLRARLLRRLRAADRYGRLHTYSPVVHGKDAVPIQVHAKLSVVDDRMLRVGSANLSNRSMGLDTECDLVVEAEGRPEVRTAITAVRDDLVAEHLGVEREAVEQALRETGSLATAIERLRGGKRTLQPLCDAPQGALEELVPGSDLLDPDRPLEAERLVSRLMPIEAPRETGRLLRGLGLLTLLLGMAALWRFTPLDAWLEPERWLAWRELLRDAWLGPPIAIGAFVLGGVLMVPLTVMIVGSALVYGPWYGFVWSLVGALASAAVSYGIGRWLWRDAARRLAGSSVDWLSRRLAQRGVLAMAGIRLVPIAPYGVVNVVAGSSHIRFRDFALGTLLGLTPGALALTVFSDQALRTLRSPDLGQAVTLGVLLLALLVAAGWVRRRLESRGDG